MYVNIDEIKAIYTISRSKISTYRKNIGRSLTLTEKILAAHMLDNKNKIECCKDYVFFKPDRIALQDVTGQMVILQFMQTELKKTLVPTTIHCDHLIRAQLDSISACQKYGIDFWKPGAGIIHQIILENYAFPGGLMIGTDSHTPNAGGLGMIAIGVGGLDAAETMAGLSWQLLYPKRIGIYLTGKLNGWASPKDIILYIAHKLTVSGATNSIIEYFGPGTESLSCTGKATITNMGAEIGATCSIFPYDHRMNDYLIATKRHKIANLANENIDLLTADSDICNNPKNYFDKIIEIDLSLLEPYVSGPYTPDLSRPISHIRNDIKNNNYINNISVALIGSCTNSSYEDMSKTAALAKQANDHGIVTKIPLFITPGSEKIRATIERDGYLQNLQSLGATVLANACGPCIGQWNRKISNGKNNTILTSFNRNFPGRNDGKRETMNFISSPEIVVALALAGDLSFNPLTDYLITPAGKKFKLQPPSQFNDVPSRGFKDTKNMCTLSSKHYHDIPIIIDNHSNRLQKLTPFEKWDGNDFKNLVVLAKIKGKCTTDHISPAGQWLAYRGHLDKLSDNMLLGATNFYNNLVGKGQNILNNKISYFSQIARQYKTKKMKWIIIGEDNYGEGSSREHAAMTPRYLGCFAILAKSFARIHETNLKKQGILTLTFKHHDDYYKILETDRLNILNLDRLAPGKPVPCTITNKNKHVQISLLHSYDYTQLEWFYSGSALNIIRNKIQV